MREYQRVLLKLEAKRALKAAGAKPILVTLLFFLSTAVASALLGLVFNVLSGSGAMLAAFQSYLTEYDDFTYALGVLLTRFSPARVLTALTSLLLTNLICGLWRSVVSVGYHGFCLDLVRGRELRYDTLFSALPQWSSVLATRLLVWLFQFLWTLLFVGAECVVVVVAAVLLFDLLPGLAAVLLIASYAAMLVGMAWAMLRYAMVDFLITDQGITGMEAIRESKRLMRGNVRRLFTLYLSFAGWAFAALGILYALMFAVVLFTLMLSWGGITEALSTLLAILVIMLWFPLMTVLYLWLYPYITSSTALFYEWARQWGHSGPGGGRRQPVPPRNFTYTWNPSPTLGTGIGPGPRPEDDGPDPGGGWPGGPPLPPKPPKDDPWE